MRVRMSSPAKRPSKKTTTLGNRQLHRLPRVFFLSEHHALSAPPCPIAIPSEITNPHAMMREISCPLPIASTPMSDSTIVDLRYYLIHPTPPRHRPARPLHRRQEPLLRPTRNRRRPARLGRVLHPVRPRHPDHRPPRGHAALHRRLGLGPNQALDRRDPQRLRQPPGRDGSLLRHLRRRAGDVGPGRQTRRHARPPATRWGCARPAPRLRQRLGQDGRPRGTAGPRAGDG